MSILIEDEVFRSVHLYVLRVFRVERAREGDSKLKCLVNLHSIIKYRLGKRRSKSHCWSQLSFGLSFLSLSVARDIIIVSLTRIHAINELSPTSILFLNGLTVIAVARCRLVDRSSASRGCIFLQRGVMIVRLEHACSCLSLFTVDAVQRLRIESRDGLIVIVRRICIRRKRREIRNDKLSETSNRGTRLIKRKTLRGCITFSKLSSTAKRTNERMKREEKKRLSKKRNIRRKKKRRRRICISMHWSCPWCSLHRRLLLLLLITTGMFAFQFFLCWRFSIESFPERNEKISDLSIQTRLYVHLYHSENLYWFTDSIDLIHRRTCNQELAGAHRAYYSLLSWISSLEDGERARAREREKELTKVEISSVPVLLDDW